MELWDLLLGLLELLWLIVLLVTLVVDKLFVLENQF